MQGRHGIRLNLLSTFSVTKLQQKTFLSTIVRHIDLLFYLYINEYIILGLSCLGFLTDFLTELQLLSIFLTFFVKMFGNY